MEQRLRWRHKWGWWVDLTLAGLVALAARCYRLSTVPAGLNRDTAANGLYALDLLRRGIWPFFVLHMGVAEPLMVYLQSASIALLGPGIVALRVVSALAGALTACGVYVLGRVLWPGTEASRVRGRYAAVIAGLGLALCPLHFHVSRMGLRAILSPLLQAVTLTFFWYAWQTGKRWAFALAGLTLGLGMYSYLAFRATLLLLPLLAASLLLVDHSAVKKRWLGLVLMGICVAVWVLPAIPFFARYPMALWGRAKEVTLSQQPLIAQQGTGRVVLLKLWAQIKMFVLPWSGQYNLMGFALLDPALFVVFCVGLVVACAQIRHSSSILLLLGLPVTLVPALLADDLEPHGLRELGVVLFVYLLIGLGGATIARWMGERWARLNGRIGQAGLAIVVISGSCVQFCRYQAFWDPAVSRTDSVHYNLADIAEARYLTEADMPVLVPLAEYERTVLRYLSSSRFLVRASGLDRAGQMRANTSDHDLAVLMPRDPDRKRLEGPTFSYDGAQYALLYDQQVYVLPPLDHKGEEAVAAWMSRAQVSPVRDPYGRDVASVYTGSGLDLTFIHMADPLDANLSGQIWLRGYTLSNWHLEPGGEVTLALFWQAQHKLARDYRLFVHLLGQDEQVLIWGDTTPGQGVYPTVLWRPDETVSSFHRLSVPADLSPGRYQIEVGFYDRLSLDRIRIVDGRGRAVADRVLVGPLKIPISSPPIEDPRLAGEAPASDGLGRLGERCTHRPAIVLAGYEPAQHEPGEWVVRPGDVISLRLEWAALARPAADYTCFVHLSAPDERILAQHDAQPLGGAYPTSIWEHGEMIVDGVSLVIPQGAEPGTYSLWTGMYNSLDNVRLSATDLTGQRLPNDRIRLGSLRVLGAGQ